MFKKNAVYLLIFILIFYPLSKGTAVEIVELNSNGQTTYTFKNTSTGSSGTIQTWTVPETAEYTIEAWGAEGGRYGGKGAYVSGTFELTAEDSIKILVGQEGSYSNSAPSGGGGTFVVANSDLPLIIAGGGGGACYSTTSSDGKGTYSSSPDGGNSGGDGAAGGGGFSLDGEDGHTTHGGYSFLNGGYGGPGDDGGASGGFGGGGGGDDDDESCSGPGGGGGYRGGNGGSNGSYATGGYSYNAGSNQASSSGSRSAHGLVVITLESEFLVLWDAGNDENYNATFNHTSIGRNGTIQVWTAPYTATYRIEVWGAQGGNSEGGNGGKGASIGGDFMISAGESFSILVGQQGENLDNCNTGGGGGSFVWKTHNEQLFIAAGGGGGAGHKEAGMDGTVLNSGTLGNSSSTSNQVGHPGSSGHGGNKGAAGWYSNGTNQSGDDGIAQGGNRPLSGGAGGSAGTSSTGDGGFGGGAGGLGEPCSNFGAGGGGGYSGGASYYGNGSGGGGGGSYNSGTNQSNASGARTGHGLVTITVQSVGHVEGNQFPNLITVDDNFPININLSNPNRGISWKNVDLIIEFIDRHDQKTMLQYNVPDTNSSVSRELNIDINVPSLVGGEYTVRYKLQDRFGNLADKMQEFSDINVSTGLKVDFSEDNLFPSEWLVNEKKRVEISFKNLEDKTLERDATVVKLEWYIEDSLEHDQSIQMNTNLSSYNRMMFTAWIIPPSVSGTYKLVYTVINGGVDSSQQQQFTNIEVKGAASEWRIFDFSLVDENNIYWTGRRFDKDHDITIDASSNPVRVTVEYRVPLMFPVVRYLGGGTWEPMLTVKSTAEMKIEEPEF
ncbi:glycine-rich protein [Chengkuizengella axinellae]|uniref:Glycine-rich protein n=1 Tax=Chengkuizengella axinellae TaxID=3064388 RepID=A0ABT9J184_9BACL|nr:glycine-rich protein [Chengkuizengella sp. 2205SS18-9]MDP5275233.1 glycine-rich protein [Chengkuizengella sp. 2205SS18-9]